MIKENFFVYDNSRYKVLLYFRGSCLTIAILYWFYQFHVANYNGFGIQFRYLTIWGLTGNVIVTGLLLRRTLTGQKEKYFAAVSAVCVLNVLLSLIHI